MKCAQCGIELDRLSKWRGSSDYCSEECKKESQEEFNRLAMNRLMQPRPPRTTARASANAVRTFENGSGRLTVVTHPVGASSPIVVEPPEAGFILEASATLFQLNVRHQPPLLPRPVPPLIPVSELPLGGALLALESILAGFRPQPRAARAFNPVSRDAFVTPARSPLPDWIPACEPRWPVSLGLSFSVAGFDTPSTVRAVDPVPASVSSPFSPGRPADDAPPPVVHRSIPSRRPARDYPAFPRFEVGSERLLPLPAVSAPRLRIHLPKPVLNPLRPRYAFAPPPEEVVENKPAEAVVTAVPVPLPHSQTASVVLKAAERDERKKRNGAKEGRAAQESEERGKQQPPRTNPAPRTEPLAKPAATSETTRPKPARVESKIEALPAVQAQGALHTAIAEKPAKASPELPVAVQSTSPVTFTAPSFGGQAEPEAEGFFARMPGWQKALAVLVLIGAAIGAWVIPSLPSGNARTVALPASAPAAAPAMGKESWETDSSGDTAGIARRRVISRYKPGRGKRDYIFEFTGQVEQRAMGWVFRVKDARNYYCLKIETTGDGTTAQLVKFAVVNGEEQPHRLVELRQPIRANSPIIVRLDVRGQNFATQINGNPVDVWIDNQIPDGTVGFSNESGERAVISSVKVSY